MKAFTYNGKTIMVSDDGQLYFRGRKLAQNINNRGYLYTTVGYKKHYVHRIVCSVYNSEPTDPKQEVNHKNGIKTDNRPDNLEWCTRSANLKHLYRILNKKPRPAWLGRSGSLHCRSKPVLSIKDQSILEHGSLAECGRYFDISTGTVWNYIDTMTPYQGIYFHSLS